MEYLLTFDSNKLLGFLDRLNFKTEDGSGRTVTESELFDAFWILYKLLDRPDGKEAVYSIRAEDEILDKTVVGGAIRLSLCSGCGQRRAVHDDLRTMAL